MRVDPVLGRDICSDQPPTGPGRGTTTLTPGSSTMIPGRRPCAYC
jgi:hypothetical protein